METDVRFKTIGDEHDRVVEEIKEVREYFLGASYMVITNLRVVLITMKD